MAKVYFRINQVASTRGRLGRYPVSRATIWRWVAAGHFPKPVKLSAGVTAWDNADLDAFDALCAGRKAQA
jgi:prophage regulatory protein